MVAIAQRRRRVASRPFRRGSGSRRWWGSFLSWISSVFGTSSSDDRETHVYAGMVAMCGLYALWSAVVWGRRRFLLFGTTEDGVQSSSSLFRRGSGEYPFPKNRPDLHLDGPNAESMNAVALEIMDTLQCHTLLNETFSYGSAWDYSSGSKTTNNNAAQTRMEGSPGVSDVMPPESVTTNNAQRQQRRRLQSWEGQRDTMKDPNADAKDSYSKDNHLQGDDRYLAESEGNAGGGYEYYNPGTGSTPTAAHLFCVAALWASSSPAASDHLDVWKDRLRCPVATSRPLTVELLELWSTARSEIPQDVLLKTLKATEKARDLLGTHLHLWAPPMDDGLEYMLGIVNARRTVDQGGLLGMSHNLGPSKLFVDVGSYLGVTSMAVSLLYPGTQIVSIEAAAPNWLLQQINWRCNHRPLFANAATSTDTANSALSVPLPTVLLSGVGPSGHASHMAKMMWRPYATTATRSWTAAKEIQTNDVEIFVQLHPWHDLLQRAGIDLSSRRIDVLNVDCEGCEYNLIPALSDQEFRAIPTILGTVHWGYIPDSKLPSSKRGQVTHQRLCQHENIARTVKECCAFPDLAVISSVQGEALVLADEEEEEERADGATRSGGGYGGGLRHAQFPPRAVTVRDVAGSLCEKFDEWKVLHHLDDIASDWGWFQITSKAEA